MTIIIGIDPQACSYFTSASLDDAQTVLQWQVQIMDWRSELGVPKGTNESTLACRPWTLLKDRRYVGVNVSARVLAILDCVTMDILGGYAKTQIVLARADRVSAISEAMKSVFCDISQNPVRRCFSLDGVAKCQTTSSIIYAFGRDRVVTPYEQMLLQGHSRNMKLPGAMRQRDVSDLAGMGIFLPCLGLCVVAMLCSGVAGT